MCVSSPLILGFVIAHFKHSLVRSFALNKLDYCLGSIVIMPKGYNIKGGSNGHFNHADLWSAPLSLSFSLFVRLGSKMEEVEF